MTFPIRNGHRRTPIRKPFNRFDQARRDDLLTIDLLPTCPDCGDLAHPSATVCEACGTKLFPKGAR